MKRFLLALTMLGFLLPLAPRAQAATDVSLNFFYDNLSSQGNWIEVADYGYAFQPNVAAGNSNWRPYSDGYWAYTDVGWTWVSYEDFGWATYHYGRWSNLADYGWVWVPGYEWGPAWVSWRTGGDYVGWAPLPPAGNGVYEGRAITGRADVEFDIGPLYYNFVDVRYIGEPVLRGRIFEPSRNVTFINQTVNVTNITYVNSTVYNYGPDYNRLNQYSTRPIQRLSLQRETTIGADFAVQGGKRGNLNRVNGNQLLVVAPAIQKSEQTLAPKQVKAKVQQPKVERGWQGISNRAQLQEEMKKENAQNVRPPSFQPQKDRKREAVAGAQEATAQPNGAAGAAQPAPAGNDQEAAKAARQAERQGREQNAGQAERPNANVNGSAEQGNQKNAREQKAQPAEQQRAERTQKAQEQKAQQEQQRSERAQKQQEQKAQQDAQRQQQQQGEKADRKKADRPDRSQETDSQAPDRAPRRADRVKESQRAEKPNRAEQAPESQRANRAEQAQQPQESKRAERGQRDQEAGRSQQASQPERAQRPQQNRQEQARPQQGQGEQNPNAERKGKKKKPGEEEQPPQP